MVVSLCSGLPPLVHLLSAYVPLVRPLWTYRGRMILALVLVASQCQVLTEAPKPKGYFYRVGLAINQFVNAATGGDPDESLSSRWGRAKKRGNKAAKAVCKTLDLVDRCHCELAIEFDDEGNPLPHQLQSRTGDQ